MPSYTSKYDHHFKIYAAIYFGSEVSWQWFKAMGIAESNLDPTAESPVGAMGSAQHSVDFVLNRPMAQVQPANLA